VWIHIALFFISIFILETYKKNNSMQREEKIKRETKKGFLKFRIKKQNFESLSTK
tara:strand:+ start:1679 stop:1843 length:165 start_codon:yes stop_codon:yes gene_type:complete